MMDAQSKTMWGGWKRNWCSSSINNNLLTGLRPEEEKRWSERVLRCFIRREGFSA
jgi:hypothetical protein